MIENTCWRVPPVISSFFPLNRGDYILPARLLSAGNVPCWNCLYIILNMVPILTFFQKSSLPLQNILYYLTTSFVIRRIFLANLWTLFGRPSRKSSSMYSPPSWSLASLISKHPSTLDIRPYISAGFKPAYREILRHHMLFLQWTQLVRHRFE